MMKKSIYAKFALVFLIIILVGNLISSLFLFLFIQQDLDTEITHQLTAALENVTVVHQQSNISYDDIELLYRDNYIAVTHVLESEDAASLLSISEEALATVDSEVVILKKNTTHSFQIPIAIVRAEDGYLAAHPSTENLIFEYRHKIFYANLISTLLGIAMILLATKFIVRPIKKISVATEEIESGNFDIHIPNNRKDELGQLIDRFNAMSKQLSETQLLRNNFISDISHEFKTPITSIEGYTKLLKNDPDESDRKEYIRIILEETKRLSTLIGDILTLNRLENENILHELTEVRLDEQIRKTIVMLEPHWSEKSLDFELHLIKANILANESLMNLVWINLIDNAIKFSLFDGSIRIDMYEEDQSIHIKLHNAGQPIQDNAIKHIFEKFYQAESSRTCTGNGLGLSIVQRVLDLHHATIEVMSSPGSGTVFHLTFHKK